MIATLRFDLSDPDDRLEYDKANRAMDMFNALWEYDQWLRARIKYEDRYELQPARDELHVFLEANDVNLID
jgi:hypothetical protein